jgi:hypothetical protein
MMIATAVLACICQAGTLATGQAAEKANTPAATKPVAHGAPRLPVNPEELILQRQDGVERIPLLPPGPGNPRNSEGSFIQLKDGRVLLVYSHFIGGGGDNSAAYLAGRFSSDNGHTWSDKDITVVANEGGCNVMSVSLLRLQDGQIALFYIRKDSPADCRVCLRTSSDEAQTWSKPTTCIKDEVGYYVMNNDRAVQLARGRIVLPVALHNTAKMAKPDWAGVVMCYLSDDMGRTWRRSKSRLTTIDSAKKRITTQEPGVVELKDGRLMMWARTTAGSQYISYSSDSGETWSPFGPSKIIAPCSPASIKRIPRTGDLLLVWNNHDQVDAAHRGKRTPLTTAISRDEGQTWEKIRTLEDDPDGWYCYIAIGFAGDQVLLGHCSGTTKQVGYLAFTQISRFGVDWLYQ